jgi:hypothetical protein
MLRFRLCRDQAAQVSLEQAGHLYAEINKHHDSILRGEAQTIGYFILIRFLDNLGACVPCGVNEKSRIRNGWT